MIWSTLRYRKAAFAGAFVALFFAAALVTACGTLMDTGLRGKVEPVRYAGAPVVVAGDPQSHFVKHKKKGKTKRKSKPNAARAWIPADLADRVKAVPGVRRVVSEVTFPLVVQGAGPVEGNSWEPLTPVRLHSGRAPKTSDEIVLNTKAERVTVLTANGPRTYKVVGTADRPYVAPDEAQRLAGHPGQVTAIGVWGGDPKVIKQAVQGTNAVVATGDERGTVEFPGVGAARTKLVSMGGALGGTSLIVALLAVVGTFGLAVQQRERELAMLRAVAATPRQLRRMLGREALLVGALATVPGALAGLPLGGWLHGRMVAGDVVPGNLPLVLGAFPPLVAGVTTVLAAWLAARVSARRITRLRPVEALGEAALTPPRVPVPRLVAGVAAVAAGVVLSFVLRSVHTDAAAGPLTPLTALLFTTAVALLGPPLARGAIALAAVPLRASGGTGELAAANLRTSARRLASVITPLTLMIAMSGTLLFAQSTLTGAAAKQARTGTIADYRLGPAVPAATADRLRQVPGVRAVTEVVHSRVRAVDSPYSVQGVTPSGLAATMDLDVRDGSLDRLGPGTMAVRDGIGMKVGDSVSFALADGTRTTQKVVAVYRRGLGFGDLTLPYDLVAAHSDSPMGTVLVSAPGVSKDALRRALPPGVMIGGAVEANKGASGSSAVNYLALGLIVAFAGIAMVNTLAMAVAGRSRELALLRLAGATRRQVLRMLRWETLAVAVIATALGAVIAFWTLTAYGAGMTGDASPHVPAPAALGIVAVTTLLALAATALPARLALRADPTRTLAARD
ncbi:ABC transporter permease [Actinomadura rupiterrae]|uniref:ABC transporter permease n=1 Tax=Actinomadura rupiterrae TaxID=559627 RepID=UPI0020A5EA37|nr:ABC transporter permease [Actinomadura rupiterrae]MCP2343013.1 putative ABC transport system permease protein [Actinomadura rupiterrae]